VYLPVRPWEGLYLFSRPEQAEHVLAANQDNYVKPFTYRPLRLMLGDGLVTAEDPLWRRHRRIIQPVFSSRNVASFAAEMDAGAQRAAARWNGSQQVELATEMSALTLHIVGRVLFSADLTAEAQPLRWALAGGQWLALLAACLPVPQSPASTQVVRRTARLFGAGSVQQQVEQLIARRLGRPAGGRREDNVLAGDEPDSQGPRDLLELLMAARDADGSALSRQESRDEIATFLVAGHETTAMALTWSLTLLSAYPQARQRLEDEIDAVLGDGPADPDRLPWTTAVVSEAMRLYPPAWTLERTAVADDDVCGTRVPAGSMVAVLPYLIHRNPAVWPNPAGFDPARFLPGAPERHRYAWLPFGGGKRGCIGAGFARQEAVLVLARLCRHYRLDLASPGLPRPRGLVTLRPDGPVTMHLTRRD
jgi:cytochrome P450